MPDSVLLVEDHQDIAELVCSHLELRGYIVDYASDGVTGLALAVTNDYDAIVLDLMLPGMAGLDVCAKLRKEWRRKTPVVMLTARDTLQDIVEGLDSGADDYLVKPFDLRELEARLRAVIRRQRGTTSSSVYQVGDLVLDTGTLVAKRGGRELALTPIGLRLLTVLLRASPRVVRRAELEREIWGDRLPDSDALRSHLYNLRKVIDRPFDTRLLHTVLGNGYRIAASQ